MGVCLSQALASFTAWLPRRGCCVFPRGLTPLPQRESGGGVDSWKVGKRITFSRPGLYFYRGRAASSVLRGRRLSLIGLAKGPIAVQPFVLTARTLIPSSAQIVHKLLFLKNHQKHTVLDRAFWVKNS